MPIRHLRGRPPQPSDGKRRVLFPKGRTCEKCGAILSRYNPSRFCYRHEPKSYGTRDLPHDGGTSRAG